MGYAESGGEKMSMRHTRLAGNPVTHHLYRPCSGVQL